MLLLKLIIGTNIQNCSYTNTSRSKGIEQIWKVDNFDHGKPESLCATPLPV